MKNIIYLSLLLLLSCESKSNHNSARTFSNDEVFHHVESVWFDLDNDQILDTIHMSHYPENDPGEYTQLTIKYSNSEIFHAKANEVWDFVDPVFVKANANAVESKRIFVAKKQDGAFMLLFGYPYPAERCELSVISVVEGQTNFQQISRFKEVTEFTDLDGNGTTELVGRNNVEIYEVSDSLKAEIGTYSPFYVLSFVKTGKTGSFQLNQPLTEKYNMENYVWKGMRYDEKIRVLYSQNGDKPKIIP